MAAGVVTMDPIWGGGAIDLEQVPAGDGWGVGVLQLERGDVDPVLAALGFFFDEVEAHVIVGAERSVVADLAEDLDVAGVGRVTADAAAEPVEDGVMHEPGVESVDPVEDPIGFRGHVQERPVDVLVELIPEFDGHVLLELAGGAGAPVVDSGSGDGVRHIGQRCAIQRVVEDHAEGGAVAGAGDAGGAEGVDDHQRQIGVEIDNVRTELDVSDADGCAGQLARLEGTGADLGGLGDRDGAAVDLSVGGGRNICDGGDGLG